MLTYWKNDILVMEITILVAKLPMEVGSKALPYRVRAERPISAHEAKTALRKVTGEQFPFGESCAPSDNRMTCAIMADGVTYASSWDIDVWVD